VTDRHALGKRSESDRAFEWLDKAPEQLALIKFDVKLPN
jgi:hypothetical protein